MKDLKSNQIKDMIESSKKNNKLRNEMDDLNDDELLARYDKLYSKKNGNQQ